MTCEGAIIVFLCGVIAFGSSSLGNNVFLNMFSFFFLGGGGIPVEDTVYISTFSTFRYFPKEWRPSVHYAAVNWILIGACHNSIKVYHVLLTQEQDSIRLRYLCVCVCVCM